MRTSNIIIILLLYVISLTSQNEVRLLTDLKPGSENGFSVQAEIIGAVENSILIWDGEDFIISDGTIDGTKVFSELGLFSTVLYDRAVLNGKLYFILKNDLEGGYSLVEYDPELQSINFLLSQKGRLDNLVAYKGRLYLSKKDNTNFSQGFFRFDFQTNSFVEIFSVDNGGIRDVLVHNDLIYTIHHSITQDGSYLASTDGTPGNVSEFYFFYSGSDSNFPAGINMTSAEDVFYMWYGNGTQAYVLYVSDGTAIGTKELKNNFTWNSFFNTDIFRAIGTIGNSIFFRGVETGDFKEDLWISDGSVAGTQKFELDTDLVVAPQFFTNFNGKLYFFGAHTKGSFSDLYGVLVTDGTAAGTEIAFDFSNHPDEINSHGWNVIAHKNRLFFEVNSDMFGSELYVSDSTESGTTNISDIAPGPASGFTYNYTSAGDNLFFFGSTDDLGVELYVYGPGPSSTYELPQEELFVAPNPTLSHITLPIELTARDKVVLTDATGQSIELPSKSGNSLDVSSLTEGTYLMSILSESKSYKSKFVKLRSN